MENLPWGVDGYEHLDGIMSSMETQRDIDPKALTGWFQAQAWKTGTGSQKRTPATSAGAKGVEVTQGNDEKEDLGLGEETGGGSDLGGSLGGGMSPAGLLVDRVVGSVFGHAFLRTDLV
jgi:hypothetical protein